MKLDLRATLPDAVLWIVVTAAVYIVAQYTVGFGIQGAWLAGLRWDATSPISQLTYRLLIYALTAGLLVAALWYRYRNLSLSDIALTRLPLWKDIGLSLAGAVLYVISTVTVLTIAGKWLGVDTGQAQDLGFARLQSVELLIAFVVLVILTPLFEEALFRGFLYGKLRKVPLPWWLPAIVVSALFGLAHLQWNVGLDVFCLSMVACALREVTGSIWAGILLHMAKNMLAFLVTFVFVTGIAG